MCNFFSCISDGSGNVFYLGWEPREEMIRGCHSYSPDSHSLIAAHFEDKMGLEYNPSSQRIDDVVNKYEYNPLTKEFKIDQLNTDDDSEEVKKFCMELDFKKIVPALIIKPIVHPFRDRKPPKKISKRDIENLKQWIKVGDSVGASVGDSVVGASVGASVGDSVGDSVVGASVGASVWASVGDSVWASVWASVRASVWASVRAYTSSFFDLPKLDKYKCCAELWERGLVPSFDGKTWRLHGGLNGEVVYTLNEGDKNE